MVGESAAECRVAIKSKSAGVDRRRRDGGWLCRCEPLYPLLCGGSDRTELLPPTRHGHPAIRTVAGCKLRAANSRNPDGRRSDRVARVGRSSQNDGTFFFALPHHCAVGTKPN